MRRCTNPLSQITGVGKGHATSNNPGFHLCLCRDIPCTGDDDLVSGSHLATNLLHFVGNKEADVLYVLPLPPSPRKDIPLWLRQKGPDEMVAYSTYLGRCADNYVTLL